MKVADAKQLVATPRERLEGGPALFGRVSFLTPGSGLYLYRYVVDNRQGGNRIDEVNILVDSVHQKFLLAPLEHAEQQPWEFVVAISGESDKPPLSEFGTFWSWFQRQGLPAGTISPVFSFVTARAPTVVVGNNYFLHSTGLEGTPPYTGIAAYGQIVAPDFGVPLPPELRR
jgi:hypothetical protein